VIRQESATENPRMRVVEVEHAILSRARRTSAEKGRGLDELDRIPGGQAGPPALLQRRDLLTDPPKEPPAERGRIALPWGSRHVGRDGVIAFVTTLVSAADSAVTVEALFQAGDTVVQYGRTRGTCRASGASFDVPECHVWTIRDGLIVEVAFFIDTALMLAALGTAAHA
jgi:ketosteroid isomerase-like protein